MAKTKLFRSDYRRVHIENEPDFISIELIDKKLREWESAPIKPHTEWADNRCYQLYNLAREGDLLVGDIRHISREPVHTAHINGQTEEFSFKENQGILDAAAIIWDPKLKVLAIQRTKETSYLGSLKAIVAQFLGVSESEVKVERIRQSAERMIRDVGAIRSYTVKTAIQLQALQRSDLFDPNLFGGAGNAKSVEISVHIDAEEKKSLFSDLTKIPFSSKKEKKGAYDIVLTGFAVYEDKEIEFLLDKSSAFIQGVAKIPSHYRDNILDYRAYDIRIDLLKKSYENDRRYIAKILRGPMNADQ